MSGHSHWAGIKQRKGVNDAKKASVFTKYGRLISIAAKQGGGNPEHNFSLRLAIDQARSVNMPKDTIERAIKKGTGELKDGAEIEEVIYEGYGPGNVAMLIKTATDNHNRTFSEIKSFFTKGGGKLGSEGSVKFMFKQMGSIEIALEGKNPEEIEMAAIEAGAEDIVLEKDFMLVYTSAANLQKVKENLEKEGIQIEGAGLVYVPLQKTELSSEAKASYENLWEKLDEHDDVQEIYDNL
ncbi:MAG TPA: YebC/PmpR family DNA-binding transcriptional regulator [Candidatus Moranbacteria bacterium]|nr:YebC/PmpR family DNA-binding transcriptional regulator [Candidatus Moranbacteria bacterium]